jgi:hypothetical protein
MAESPEAAVTSCQLAFVLEAWVRESTLKRCIVTGNRLRWLIVVLLATVAISWLWQAVSDSRQVLAASAFALTVAVGAFWQYRVHAALRWRSAVDAYAERALEGENAFVIDKPAAVRRLDAMNRDHRPRLSPTKRHGDKSAVTIDPIRRRSK